LILSALKHPLRRKILRMLSDKPLSFSEIRESVSIDSGHLNYHIKSLGDVVVHTEDGKYALSSVGWAAIELVSNVEEHDKSNRTGKRARRVNRLSLVFSAIFAVALLTASVYALTFTTQEQVDLFQSVQGSEMAAVILEPGQTFDYDITGIQLDFGSGYGYSVGQQETLVYTPPTRNDFFEWTKYFSSIEFRPTGKAMFALKIQDQDGIVYNKHAYIGGSTSGSFPLGSETSRFGNYSLQMENLGDDELNATLSPVGGYTVYKRPLFAYGVAGLILLIIYPVLLSLSWNWNKKLQS